MIAIGCDHGGYELKCAVMNHFLNKKIEFVDLGCNGERCDYPDIAETVCKKVTSGECELAILVCGTGIGMSIAANKVNGIRAAVCSEHYSAKYTRLHNDANVLCLGGRVTGDMLALELVDIFLTTEAEGDRHERRREKIAQIEKMMKN